MWSKKNNEKNIESKFSYKIFKQGNDTLLAVADSSILGKILKQNGITLEVKCDFYHERIANENKIIELVKSATIVNAIGNKIINLLLNNNLIDKNSVLWIEGVPHAQIIKIT